MTVTVARAGTSGDTSSFTTYYKVYSSDTTAPTLVLVEPRAWPPGPHTARFEATDFMENTAVETVNFTVD